MRLTTNPFEERRECRRYECKADKTAFVAVRPSFKKIGALKDISRGGLSFRYLLSEDNESTVDCDGNVHIDLFVSNNGFYLQEIACKLAYESPVHPESPFLVGPEFRDCGLKFEDLTEEHQQKVEHFLRCYTTGECELQQAMTGRDVRGAAK